MDLRSTSLSENEEDKKALFEVHTHTRSIMAAFDTLDVAHKCTHTLVFSLYLSVSLSYTLSLCLSLCESFVLFFSTESV